MWFLVVAWIFTLHSEVVNAVDLTDAPAHTLKKCVQNERRHIHCDEIEQDNTEMISYWPPGSYALPMTQYGCPESSLHGWREGFIRLAWEEERQIQIVSNFQKIEIVNDSIEAHFLTRKHQLFIPATSNTITLYFCYKQRKNKTVDKGVWPDESYSIYSTEEDCPPAFEKHYSNITIPALSWWVSDGYLPDFNIYKDENNNNTEGILQLKICSRWKSSNKSSTDDENISNDSKMVTENGIARSWTHFFLIKNNHSQCPMFASTYVFEESVYIEKLQNMSLAMGQIVDTLCFYEQNTDTDSLYDRRRKKGYSVTIDILTEGQTKTSPDYERYLNRTQFTIYFYDGILNYIQIWKIVDLGRTIPISAVEITTERTSLKAAFSPWHQPPGQCIAHEFICYISSGKWNFLQSEALSCLYKEYCRIAGSSLSLVFKRIMEGRYVTLIHQEVHHSFLGESQHYFYTVKVFTEIISYDPTADCNVDIGMQNYEQISASSTLSGFNPFKARLNAPGWCPQLDDPQPYLKVIFPMIQTIEGIIMYNSREVFRIQGLQTFVSFGSSFITFTYSKETNGTTQTKILRVDSSKLTTETHTFWFMKAIRAKTVMLFLHKEQTFDLACLRFEILGCKNIASYDTFFTRERQVPPFESVGYVSEVYVHNTVLTSIDVPNDYQDSQLYKWVVQFPENHFIKLVFMSLQSFYQAMQTMENTACNDSIIISNDLVDISPEKTRVIYVSFKYQRSLSVETKETVIVLSVLTCPVANPSYHGIEGFKAVATYQAVPSCFTINGRLDWKDGSYEVCRHSSMFISSLSYLGFMFLNTTEVWDIEIPTKRISLRFVEFNVPCKSSANASFIIKDKGNERSHCNINKPPDVFNSSSDKITVSFNRGSFDPSLDNIPIFIGVRIFYTTIEEPDKHLIDYRDIYPKSINVALHKDTERSFNLLKYYSPGNLVDGKTFPEAGDASLQDCFVVSGLFNDVWWLLDLQALFVLDYIVLFGAIIERVEISDGCQLTLSTGVSIYGLQPTGYTCAVFGREKVINQKGIETRYVSVQSDCKDMALCEVQVYGQLASTLAETATKEPSPTSFAIHGEWSEWSPWSDECFCDGRQYRYRACNDPEPAFNGRYCVGDYVTYRSCHLESGSCQVFQEHQYLTKKLNYCTNNQTDSTLSGWSAWTEWSSCSSDCGFGLKSRHRECISTSNQEIRQQCAGESSEEKSCVSNDKCLVCSDTFAKCYSIITKYTNWNQAQLECLKRNMTLVSILSLSEQRFVKYLLRQKRSIDNLPNNYFNADFYVHIGLQTRLDLKYSTPIWDNGRYAFYFTAWKLKNSLRCTRMNFKYIDEDNTWESENCEDQLAEYTMCEYHKRSNIVSVVKGLKIWTDDGKQMLPEEIPLSEYSGKINVTVSGQNCDGGSYCKDYNNWGFLHCLNTKGAYEECSVNLPPVENASLVYRKYLGKLNKTFSGKACQNWSSLAPHDHQVHGDLLKGESILDAANYCRDPGDTDFLWCFTEDPDTRWEPCLLQELTAERQCVRKREYTGTKNTTITGNTCMRWDKVGEINENSILSTVDLTDTENYCRDLFNYGFIWCYIDSAYETGEWEPCIPEEIESETIQGESKKNVDTQSYDVFACDGGKKIPKFLQCNGIIECEDNSDETGCLDMFTDYVIMQEKHGNMSINRSNFEKGSFFRCGTGEWISVIAKCDTVIDCLDASDEISCIARTAGFSRCAMEQFQCDDGDCIHISQVCNFVEDCLDGSDEYCDLESCSPMTEYSCTNGQCIPSSQRCDAVKQCTDGSDENECDTCQSGVFHCDIALCIPTRLRCDNFTHCQDETDELDCEPNKFTSCQDVWNAGFRKTGYYNIGPINAYCSFKNVFENGELTTVLLYDIKYDALILFHVIYIYTGEFFNIPSTTSESKAAKVIFSQSNTNCTQQVMVRCMHSHVLFSQYENGRECFCGIVNYDIYRNRKSPRNIETCPVVTEKNLTLLSAKPYLTDTDIDYTDERTNRSIMFFNIPTPDIRIEAGPAICKHDFKPTDDDFACNTNGKLIPKHERCVYGMDSSGFPTGCSDGSHLISCEYYDCPENMLKCPGSYCIPYIFLCDGVHQCPGGEDEEECGCEQTNNEVLIVYDAVSTEGPNFARFARQFHSHGNIVRLLGYKATQPLDIYNIKDTLLEVNDIELNLSPIIQEKFQCNYKIFARDFLNSVHFTNDGMKGVILIQNSEVSRDVVKDITDYRTDLNENLRVYRVSQYLDTDTVLGSKNVMTAPSVTDIHVKRWKTLEGIGAEYFSEMCKLSSKTHCQNGYKCLSSKSCIPMEQVCDGRKQCLNGDDEVLCDFKCPADCKCSGYFANCSGTDFKPNMLQTVPRNTRHLDFSLNNKLSSVLQSAMINLTKLSILNVSSCSINILSQNAFLKLRNLQTLDLSFNRISTLTNHVFLSLIHLKNLYLQGNKYLSKIEQHALNGLSLIRDLQIANAKIVKILSGTFEGLNLKTLDLSNNEIQEIDKDAFRESFIENINFDRNPVKQFNKEIFTGLVGLKTLKTPAFKFCCIRPNYVPEQNCYPQKDEFSSCDDLMRHSGLQFMIWLIGIMALIGNVLSLIYRIKYDRERLKLGYGIFVTNLAVADFLMAVYLMIIAIADSAFRKRYIYVDDYWRHSIWCNIAGILSTTSSEASVLFLCFITLDRLLVIKYPFGGIKITTKAAIVCVTCAWLFSVFVALLPVTYVEYFNNEFYSKSGVCIALPLTRDRPPGWAYSLALFVGLNFITFVLVAVGQLSIFVEIRKSAGIAKSAATSRKRDLKVARNLLLVVATDFLCWFPIGVMGLMALSGHPVSGEVYAWAAVFILPVNSALNPLLYTLSAIFGAKSFSPRAEEQSFMKITKDIGENAIKCMMAGRHVLKKPFPMFQNISALHLAELDISLKKIMKIAVKIACILDTMHSSSLGIQSLDENSVFVEILNGKLIGNVRIKSDPFVSHKTEDKEKNIHQFGMILRRLIAIKVRQE